jgi:hypothetical protein
MADVVDRRFVRVVGAEVGFMPKSGSTGLCLFKSANFPAGKPGSAVGGVASRSRGPRGIVGGGRANHLADLRDREAAAPWRQGRPNAHQAQRALLPPGMPVEVVSARASPNPTRWDRLFDAGTVPDVAVEPLWLELIGCPATTFVVVNSFDCATAHPFNGAE